MSSLNYQRREAAAPCGRRASVEPEATAAAMAEATRAQAHGHQKDREPHRWGVGGPGIPGRLGRRVQAGRTGGGRHLLGRRED